MELIYCAFIPRPSTTIVWRVAEVAGADETSRNVEELPTLPKEY